MTTETETATATETNEAATAAAETVDATAAATPGGAAEAAAASESASTEAPAQVAVRPEQLPDEFWDDAAGAVKVSDLLKAHLDLKAEVDAARTDVPESADGYELAVSEAVKLPEGYKIDIEKDSPFARQVLAAAHKHKLPRAAVQDLVDAEARRQIAEQEVSVADFVEGKKSLGENADARIQAAMNWVSANLSSKSAQVLMANVGPAAVPALEEIIAMRSGPSVPGGLSTPAKADRKFGDGWFSNMPAKS